MTAVLKHKAVLFIFFGILFIALGYYREFFFVHINNIATIKYYGKPTGLPVPGSMRFINTLSYKTIYYLKYPLTILSFLLFYGLSLWCLKTLTNDKKLLKWLTYSYLLLLLLSSVSMLWAYFVKVNLQDDEYTFSRWLMGIAQSPLVVLFLLAASKLIEKQTK
ncbi:MAG: hypothetical protein ACXVP0_07940 [Bacteroidia bacterium]